MTEMRKVNYRFDAVALTELCQTTSKQRVMEALGYLSSWNFTFPLVDIFIQHGDELTAVYRNDTKSNPGCVIGAIWHNDDGGGQFSFHS